MTELMIDRQKEIDTMKVRITKYLYLDVKLFSLRRYQSVKVYM